MTNLRITHTSSGEVLADGPIGWGITPFEGNYYVRRKFLRTDKLKTSFRPGLCIYKFFYVWMDLHVESAGRLRNIAWKYWLPNPALPFIWWRVALPGRHPELTVEEYS